MKIAIILAGALAASACIPMPGDIDSGTKPIEPSFFAPHVYKLGDYVDTSSAAPDKCDPVKRSCDIIYAFRRAEAACLANKPRNQGGVGCRFEFPPGDLTLSEPIDLCRGHELIGAGGRMDATRTLLRTPANVSCIRVRGFGQCEQDSAVPGAESGNGAYIEGLACAGSVATSTVPVFGILMEGSARVDNVLLRQYTHGVQVTASVTREPPTNANLYMLNDVHVWNNEHAGFWAQGADANAGVSVMLDGIDNCRAPERWPQFEKCASISDRSFLGNTHIASHVAASNGNSGYILGTTPNNQTTAVGIYQEGGDDFGELGPNAAILGQISNGRFISNDPNSGLELNGRIANRLAFNNLSDPDNRVELRLGDWGIGGVAFASYARSVPRSTPFYLRANKPLAGMPWRWALQSNASREAVGVSLVSENGNIAGQLYLPQLGESAFTGWPAIQPWCPWRSGGACAP